jgi:hypothetical protein
MIHYKQRFAGIGSWNVGRARPHPCPGAGAELVVDRADDGVEAGAGAEDEAGVGALQHQVASRDEHLPRRRRHSERRTTARRLDERIGACPRRQMQNRTE